MSGDPDGGAGMGGSNDGGGGTGGSSDGGAGTGGSDDGSAGAGGSDDGGAGMDGSSDGGDSGTGTSLADYCQRTAERYFDRLQHCYGRARYTEASRARSVDRYHTRCLHSESGVAAGRLAYDGTRATKCLETIDTDACVGSLLDDAACEGVFEGLVPNGGDCYAAESLIFTVGVDPCANGYCDDDGCPGTCQPFAAREASCENAECGPDDYCEGNDGVCLARAGEGEACAEARCAAGLTCLDAPEPSCVEPVREPDAECGATEPCSGPTVCVDGRCRARVELGQSCRIEVHCPEGAICTMLPGEDDASCVAPQGEEEACSRDNQCDQGLECEIEAGASTGTCEIDPDARGLNDPCSDGPCHEGLWCRIDEANPDGVCAEPVGRGESCRSDGSPSFDACVEGLFCTNAGTCQPAGNQGDPCNASVSDSCVVGLWCSRTTGLCTSPAGEGSTCNPIWQETCQEGLACDCGLENRDECRDAELEPVATDTCQPAASAGEPCFRDAECERGFCDFDSEAPPTTPGTCLINSSACLP